ncbi:hypothetical protein BH10ACI2_BH10ACI2_13600 [soil metagenome]
MLIRESLMELSEDKSAIDRAISIVTDGFVSEDDLRRFIEIFPLPAFVVDGGFDFVYVNDPAYHFLGYRPKELAPVNLTSIVRSEESWSLPDIVDRFLNGSENKAEWEFLRQDREWVWGEVFSQSLTGNRWLLFVSDISARKRSDASFIRIRERRWQAQKIEALERLAGGIAHDFNNLLAVILLQTEMLSLQLGPESPLVRRVDEIKAVSNDAAGIVRQLLAFGRKQMINPSPVIVNDVVEQFWQKLRLSTGDSIRPFLHLDPNLGTCFVDPSQIAQALNFLTANAIDAMPDGGMLTIETANILIDKNNSHSSQAGGLYIQIVVSDTGVGMDHQTEDHIFEPFFLTKDFDKGAGLSMAAVYGIVKQQGGFIWVESELGRGTTFRIQFPRIDQQNIEMPSKVDVEISATGSETVLVVDDDQSVRRIASEILRVSGYKVLEAKSGMEALEIAQSYSARIDVLLTDYSMPQMNGQLTADGVRKLHPETAVLFMSGNIGDVRSASGGVEKSYGFIGKPFSSATLTQKISEAVGDKAEQRKDGQAA